jgi:hypothetical protein
VKRLLGVLGAGLLLAAAGAAQMVKPETVVEVRVEPARVKLTAGAAAGFTVVAVVLEGFHINSNKPAQEYLIPTRLELIEAAGFELEKVTFPAGELKSFGFAPDEKLSVYEGTVKVRARLRAKSAAVGAHTLRLVFHYQACNDQICLRPAQREVKLAVNVVAGR